MPQIVLLTGVSGFIAKHCAVKLLNAGYAVRGTLRSMARADGVRAALKPHLKDAAALERLSFTVADLSSDAGWDMAAEGVDAVMHTASPFPIAQPKNADELIRPAVDGTLRVLRAAKAAGVKRVVLTSSTVSVLTGQDRVHSEADWLDPADPRASAYARSKVMAERAAWDFVKTEAPDMALTAVNPGFVLGPPLDQDFGSSVSVIRRFLSGKDPAVPPIGFPVVDVRDVAEMHLRALQKPETAGKRYLAVAGPMWMQEMTQALKDTWPDRKIPTRKAPAWLMRVLALFDGEIRAILPSLGRIERADNTRAREEMGMVFVPPKEALLQTATYLVDNRLV